MWENTGRNYEVKAPLKHPFYKKTNLPGTCYHVLEGWEWGAWQMPSSGLTPNCVKLLRWQSLIFLCSSISLRITICHCSHQVRSNVKTTTKTTTIIITTITPPPPTIFSRAPEHRRPLDTERFRRFAPNSAYEYWTADTLVLLHTLYSRTYTVRGTSSWYQPEIPVPAWTSPLQLEYISPPSSTNSKGFRTRAEVDWGYNKGPPQTSQGAKSVPRWWCARDKSQCTDKYTYKGGKNNFNR